MTHGGEVVDGRGSSSPPASAHPPPAEGDGLLEQLDARYRSLFVDHPHAVFSLALDGQLVEVNPASGRLTGYSEPELLSRNFADFLVPDDVDRAQEAFAQTLLKRPQRVDLRILRVDGTPVDLDVTAIPLVVADEVHGVYGIAEDVTEMRRAARELRAARQLAASAADAKADFVARVSHEVRTPLTGLLAAAELLVQTSPTPEQAPLIETMRRSGGRLLRLVDNVMQFAAVEADALDEVSEEFDLHAVIDDSVALAGAAARLKGLRVELQVDDDVPGRVRDHPAWTTQILDNLLSNAVKYTDRGSVGLRVSVTTTERTGRAVLYRVHDTGVGIAASAQDKIWEPFTQGAAGSGSGGGVGLGLAIVKQLVSVSGGGVSLVSRPGEGSTFSVLMPIR